MTERAPDSSSWEHEAVDLEVASKLSPMPREIGKRAITGSREINGRDSVSLYLEEIARTPLLDAAAEVELSKAIEAGLMAEYLLSEVSAEGENGGTPSLATTEELEWLASEGQRATDVFIKSNLRLVVSIARKYGRASMPMLDLIQEGNGGLMHAVKKFDYTKGYKFSTYATWWVRQSITRGIAQQSRVVRLPVHVVEKLNQVGGVGRTLERELGREPELAEIAAELEWDIAEVTDLVTWGQAHISLDTPIDDSGDTILGDVLDREVEPGPDDYVVNTDMLEHLDSIISLLDDRAADVIRLRYGLIDGCQYRFADIGAKHGISAERVRQIERATLQKLRQISDPELRSS